MQWDSMKIQIYESKFCYTLLAVLTIPNLPYKKIDPCIDPYTTSLTLESHHYVLLSLQLQMQWDSMKIKNFKVSSVTLFLRFHQSPIFLTKRLTLLLVFSHIFFNLSYSGKLNMKSIERFHNLS